MSYSYITLFTEEDSKSSEKAGPEGGTVLINSHRLGYFFDSINDSTTVTPSLHLLKQFWTGFPSVPTTQSTMDVVCARDIRMPLPQAVTCNYNLVISICHRNYEDFKAAANSSLCRETIGFGVP